MKRNQPSSLEDDFNDSESMSIIENDDRNGVLDFDRFSLLIESRSFKRVMMKYDKWEQLTVEEKEEQKNVRLRQIHMMHAKALDIAVETMHLRYQHFERANFTPSTTRLTGSVGVLKENLYEIINHDVIISNLDKVSKDESSNRRKVSESTADITSFESNHDDIINKDIIVPNHALVLPEYREKLSKYYPPKKRNNFFVDNDARNISHARGVVQCRIRI